MSRPETKHSFSIGVLEQQHQNMALRVVLAFLCLLCVDAWRLFAPEPPVWPTSYTAKGIINLPYAEIGEPFDAWYDGPNQRSRIDYYSGRPN
jgi:hypothetical protein